MIRSPCSTATKRKEKGSSSVSGSAVAFQQLLHQLGDDYDSPVDFQLPDWLKKPLKAATPYTSIRRNVYLTKRIKRHADDDGIFCSCTPPPSGISSVSVCERDCLCGMLLSTCSRSCKCGSLCANKPFQNRPIKKVKLIETERCGLGLVADEDIKRGDFVIEYVGEVIDDKKCEERLWKMKHCGETNFYLCEINRDMVIDATYKGNKSRFINHSCQPNTEMQKWAIDGETRIGIFATRDIRKEEELTYDYQFVQFGADQDCYCGALGCRQKLGNKHSKLKLSSDTDVQLTLFEDEENGRSNIAASYSVPWKKKSNSRNCIGEVVRVWSRCDERYVGGVILGFNCYSREHTIIKEDGHIENFDLSKEDWDFVCMVDVI
ncbi:histone-lysine N-methyltransferase ASHH3-like isoform X3 [Ananas comosus]|uniref:Histone-lysine N-methyltransferase ASHH3-like isoform X3 n=1 Tax=Ananas comosus TaxID=4615 RepID=A0A6P5EPH0_ANACO|nr:histone-lysine N-methyltransferase ASHH3-like isoform X3 [Ananas comosus]